MKRNDIFERLAIELWENEMIDVHNYNHDFQSFYRDFLPMCNEKFDDVLFIHGEVIE